ncbi:MAG: hypothetical protein N2445_00855 [Acidobacteria bacterium]|nr:hypothetical protein [Acidobacteriota bacterium]
MKCEDFEKFVFENPKAKIFPNDYENHLDTCNKCKYLWKVQESLLDIGRDSVKFSFPLDLKANLITKARKRIFRRTFFPMVEDSFILSLIFSLLIIGIFASASNVEKSPWFDSIKPYFKEVSRIILPFIKEFHSFFSTPANYFWGIFGLFIVIFSLTLFVKTLNPKRATVYF